MRRVQIIRTLLETLSMAGGYALEKSRLLSFVDDLVKPPLQFTEQGQILADAKAAGWIRKVENSADPGLEEWVITELGRNYLASL